MLMRLLRQYLRPYRSMIIATIVLATLGTMGALYLPSLNAAIIDEGVAKGDTAFIWRTGGIMLVVEDAGPGVEPEQRDAIFHPFTQGEDVPSHAPGTVSRRSTNHSSVAPAACSSTFVTWKMVGFRLPCSSGPNSWYSSQYVVCVSG